jgi:hypothetical protein
LLGALLSFSYGYARFGRRVSHLENEQLPAWGGPGWQLLGGNKVAAPGNLVLFRRMTTQQTPVRGGGPDVVQGIATTQIAAALHLVLHTVEITRRIQADTCRLSQYSNDFAAQTTACRFGLERTLRRRRLDKARGVR